MTEYVFYVNPAANSGGDGTQDALTGVNCAYQTLNLALTAKAGTGVSGDVFRFRCSGAPGGWVDSTGAVINNWLDGVSVIIEGYNGNYTGRQLGDKFDNTNCYALITNATRAISIEDKLNVDVIDLQVESTRNASFGGCIVSTTDNNNGTRQKVDGCRLKLTLTAGNYGDCIALYRNAIITNNTLEGNGDTNALNRGIRIRNSNGPDCYNNTIYNFGTGIDIQNFDNGTFHNNAIAGSTNTDWVGGTSASGTYSYNADSNDGTRPNGAVNNITLSTTLTDEFVDPAGGDFNVASDGAANNIWDAGTSGGSIPTVDIVDTARSNYSIGAWEFVGGAPVTPGIKLGGTDINKAYLGATELTRIYLGSVRILGNPP